MQYYDRTSSYIHEKNDDSSQLLALIISALEPFRRKCCIGFDAELNGLQSDPIGFLEVVEDKKIVPKYQQNKGVGIMSKRQYFAF